MPSSGDANVGSAAEILSNGESCRAVIVEAQPLGKKNQRGDDMWAFMLTVLADGSAPYQVPVGNPVRAGGVPLIYPGNNVPAKRLPSRGEKYIVIDWEAAIAEATHPAHPAS